jgi:hypothetical protein
MPSIPAQHDPNYKIKCDVCGHIAAFDTAPGRFALVAVSSDDTIDLRAPAALPVHVMICDGCGAIRLLQARSLRVNP